VLGLPWLFLLAVPLLGLLGGVVPAAWWVWCCCVSVPAAWW